MYELEKLLNQNTELDSRNAERVVSLAETLRNTSSLDKAYEVVGRLKPSKKNNFLIRLEKIATELEGKDFTEENKAIIEASHFVELSEVYQYEFIIRKAMQEVEKLPESQAKEELIARLCQLNK